MGHFCIAKGVRFRGFRTLIDTGLMAPSSIGSSGAWVRLLLELNADLSTKHSISSSGALSGHFDPFPPPSAPPVDHLPLDRDRARSGSVHRAPQRREIVFPARCFRKF
jgi:hypothetical protein